MRERLGARLPDYRRRALSIMALVITTMAFPDDAGAGDSITTPEVVAMLAEAISEDVIRTKIEVDGCLCETSAQWIVDLFTAGASEELVWAMIEVRDESNEGPPDTNALVLLLREGVSEDIIEAKIELDGCDCDTSAASIVSLKQAGASDNLIVYLIRRSEE